MAMKSTTGSKGAGKPSAKGGATIEGKAEEPKKKKKSVGPIKYLQQARDEARKVTWTSRNETMISTVMVLIMVTIMAIFFFIVDQLLRLAVGGILQIG